MSTETDSGRLKNTDDRSLSHKDTQRFLLQSYNQACKRQQVDGFPKMRQAEVKDTGKYKGNNANQGA